MKKLEWQILTITLLVVATIMLGEAFLLSASYLLENSAYGQSASAGFVIGTFVPSVALYLGAYECWKRANRSA